MRDVWELIKAGDFEGACSEADLQAAGSASLLAMRNKVRALLHLQKFEEAEQCARRNIDKASGQSEGDFIFLGIALWYERRLKEAMSAWEAALSVKYTDAAGGVRVPMLLYYSAVRMGNSALREKAMRLLRHRSPSSNWPGPLADFVAGESNETTLRSAINPQANLRARETCQAEFYIGVIRLENGDQEGRSRAMTRAIAQGPISYLEPEYYLARWESEEIGEGQGLTV